MAGNKKSKRKPGASRVHTFTSKGNLPILFRSSPDDERALKLMPHTELSAMREGKGNEESYWVVVDRISWASTLASMVEFSFDPAPVLNAGIDAMMDMYNRYREHGKFVFKAEELKAAGDALILADDMHDATTRRQHRDALQKLMAGVAQTFRASALHQEAC